MVSIKEGMLKEGSLGGKTVLVTGGGTGLCKSMGAYFSELGANLVITSRKMEVLAETAREINEKTGNPVLPLAGDVRDYDEVQNVIDMARKEFGGVDVLINNAAGNFVSPTERLSNRAFDTIVDIVLKQAMIKKMGTADGVDIDADSYEEIRSLADELDM